MYQNELDRLKKANLLRSLRRIDSAQGPRVIINGRSYLLMSGNNYLGLANHPLIRQAAIEAIHQYGVGSGASRLISGNMRLHEELEFQLARFKGTEAALVFNTGYMANLALLSCIVPQDGLVVVDRACHASLIDGVRLRGQRFRTFNHQNLKKLEELLKAKTPRRSALIVTDGVFSMEGDIAPLPQLLAIARKYDARILLDDAHGTGVLGKHGRGTLEHFGLDPRTEEIIQMGTLGKAIGGFGAYAAGPKKLVQYLLNKARTFIYTTALPPMVCAAAITALELIDKEPDRLSRLWENRGYLHRGLQDLGITTLSSESPILSISFSDVTTGLRISEALYNQGILIPAIRPPTVPRGTSRIRITAMATHTQADLDFALTIFKRTQEMFGPIS